jgi:hypothetical protein
MKPITLRNTLILSLNLSLASASELSPIQAQINSFQEVISARIGTIEIEPHLDLSSSALQAIFLSADRPDSIEVNKTLDRALKTAPFSTQISLGVDDTIFVVSNAKLNYNFQLFYNEADVSIVSRVGLMKEGQLIQELSSKDKAEAERTELLEQDSSKKSRYLEQIDVLRPLSETSYWNGAYQEVKQLPVPFSLFYTVPASEQLGVDLYETEKNLDLKLERLKSFLLEKTLYEITLLDPNAAMLLSAKIDGYSQNPALLESDWNFLVKEINNGAVLRRLNEGLGDIDRLSIVKIEKMPLSGAIGIIANRARDAVSFYSERLKELDQNDDYTIRMLSAEKTEAKSNEKRSPQSLNKYRCYVEQLLKLDQVLESDERLAEKLIQQTGVKSIVLELKDYTASDEFPEKLKDITFDHNQNSMTIPLMLAPNCRVHDVNSIVEAAIRN